MASGTAKPFVRTISKKQVHMLVFIDAELPLGLFGADALGGGRTAGETRWLMPFGEHIAHGLAQRHRHPPHGGSFVSVLCKTLPS